MKYIDLFEEFKIELSLSTEPIRLIVLPGTQKNQLKGSNLMWSDAEKTWIIEFVEQHDFFLAHELGHIYLAIKYSCPYFAKQTRVPVNVNIGFYNSCIIDSFVNYNLSKYDKFYSYLLDLLDIYLNLGKDGPDPSTPDLLGFFLNIYLDLHYCLRQEDLKNRKISISNYIEKIENLILAKSKITNDQLNKIKGKLNEFEDFKDMEKNTSIIHYIFQVLKIIPFWSKNELVKNIRLIFNIKKIKGS